MRKVGQRKRDYSRRVETRSIRERILILCEGSKTEPNYFRKFSPNVEPAELDVDGKGANTLSLVHDAIRRREAANKDIPYNQVWCVFDRDVFPADDFNQARKVAEANHIHVAYSNPCFELWYFLHYHFIDTAIDRYAYSLKLAEFVGRKYKKNDKKMYDILKDRQYDAIQNAKTLMRRYYPCNPERDNPSTNVYILVEFLNNFRSDDSA